MRTEKLVKYLPEFGWESLVICLQEKNFDDSQTHPSEGSTVVRVKTPIPSWFSYQLAAWVWSERILRRARVLIRDLRPDLIYATGPPFPHAMSALKLAREAGLPLVVDFRDSWSLDPHLSGGVVKQAAKRVLCRWAYPLFERKLFERADAIITNTPSMRLAYVRKFQAAERRIHLVPNGFDEADFCEPAHSKPARKIVAPLLRPLLRGWAPFS